MAASVYVDAVGHYVQYFGNKHWAHIALIAAHIILCDLR